MIRAVVKSGMIQPLEPLPANWDDGREVVVDELDNGSANGPGELDVWSSDMNALTAGLTDPDEWREIETALTDADRQAKALVRREMRLPE